MPDIQLTLQGNDLGFLKMVAGAWGIDLVAPDVHTALPLLVNALLNRSLVSEIIESLPGEAHAALEALQHSDGVMPWAMFTRRFGEVRAMGAARPRAPRSETRYPRRGAVVSRPDRQGLPGAGWRASGVCLHP